MRLLFAQVGNRTRGWGAIGHFVALWQEFYAVLLVFYAKHLKLTTLGFSRCPDRHNFVIYHSWSEGLVLKSAAVYVYLVKSGYLLAGFRQVRCEASSQK